MSYNHVIRKHSTACHTNYEYPVMMGIREVYVAYFPSISLLHLLTFALTEWLLGVVPNQVLKLYS